jgi:hypothetical protein
VTSGVLARAVPLVLPVPSAVVWDAQTELWDPTPRCAAAGCTVAIDGRSDRRFCSQQCQKRTWNAARQAATAARVWPCEHCGRPIRGGRSTQRFCGDTCRWRARNARVAKPPPTDSGGDWLGRFNRAAARWDREHGRTHPWA